MKKKFKSEGIYVRKKKISVAFIILNLAIKSTFVRKNGEIDLNVKKIKYNKMAFNCLKLFIT